MNGAPTRSLGFFASSAIIIGAVIGSGVFLNIPIVTRYANSPGAALLIWLLGGLVWLPQIVILAEMGTAYPNQGGPYYYLYKAGSPALAFLYTWTAFLTSDTPTITIIALLAASAASFFLPALSAPLPANIFAAALIFLFAFIQTRNVRTGAAVQMILTTAKLLPLFVIVAAGFFAQRTGAFYFMPRASVNGGMFWTVTTGVSTTVWAYAGFVNILYMAGEVREPAKNLPRALIGSVAFVIAAYALISYCTALLVPHESIAAVKDGEYLNPFLYVPAFKEYAAPLFSLFFLISMLGVLNSVIMTQPRLEYAMANDKLFFPVFGKLNPRFGTPAHSIWIQCGIAVVLLLLGNIENLLGYFSLSYVLQNALVYGALFRLRARPDYTPSYTVRFWKSAAVFSIAAQLYLAYGIFLSFPLGGLIACAALIGTGLPVYRFFKRKSLAK